MQIFLFLIKRAPLKVALVSVFSIISGLSSAGLLAFINNALVNGGHNAAYGILLFALLLGWVFILQIIAEYLGLKLSLEATEQFRKDLIVKITRSSLRDIERIGTGKLFAVLTRDVAVLVDALANIPIYLANVSIIIATLGYAIYLSSILFSYIFLVLLVGVAFYLVVTHKSERYFKEARKKEDVLFKHLFSVINGIKELKLDLYRRKSFLQKTFKNITKQKNVFAKARSVHIIGWNINSLFTFAAIGVLLYSGLDLPIELLTTGIIIIFYIMGPLGGVASMYPLYIDGYVSYMSIKKLTDEMIKQEKNTDINIKKDWDSVSFKEIQFVYTNKEDQEDYFSVGPLNIEIKKNSIIYITGGNGSGKTTLIKILAGLYMPDSGVIRIGELEILDANREWYRNKIGAVFSDYYLFDHYDVLFEKKEEADILLEKFNLSKKIKIGSNPFDLDNLSQGQKKRLALLVAILEDKEIYIFDEWAAEQEPIFREYFYRTILPEMKANGKTVIVVTHDDRYFDRADFLYKLEHGHIIDKIRH